MKNRMLVSAKQLWDLHSAGSCLIVDCRFDLADPDAGYSAYLEAHVPDAVYANLDKDLSSPITPSSGRHPLPDADTFSNFLAGIGWAPGRRIVAYDDVGGAFAARLWWLMKYFGYDQAALLDGGFPAWLTAGFPTHQGRADMDIPAASPVKLKANNQMVLSAPEVIQGLGQKAIVLLDARAPERYRGDVEPLDAVAGHVPGAENLPFGLHLDQDKHFKPLDEIQLNWQTGCSDNDSNHWVHMCGSGVTACFNQFAAELAGKEGSRIYAGSWSEWIRDPSRGIGTG